MDVFIKTNEHKIALAEGIQRCRIEYLEDSRRLICVAPDGNTKSITISNQLGELLIV